MHTSYSPHVRKPPLAAFQYMVNHMILPPYLPQKDDFNVEHEAALSGVVIHCLDKYEQHAAQDEREFVRSVRTALANLDKVHSAPGGCINEEELCQLLDGLLKQPSAIPLHIREQNAAVFICNVDGKIHFETFELSPSNSAVYDTNGGRLQRAFPSLTVSVEPEVFVQEDFITTVAHTLTKMSHQHVPGMRPTVKKAGQMHDEDRDTSHPYMISESFVGFLASVGESVAAASTLKNTREEVLWKDARAPWRRSPRWLLIRVMLDLGLSRPAAQHKQPKRCYKEFMIFLLSHIRELAQEYDIPSDMLFAIDAKIHQRLLKARAFINPQIAALVGETERNNQELLNKRWLAIQKEDTRSLDLAELGNIDPAGDAKVKLPVLDQYLAAITLRAHASTTVEFQPEAGLPQHTSNSLPSLDGLEYLRDEVRILDELHSFEEWVSSHLATWRAQHARNERACIQLYHLLQLYHRYSVSIYAGNPEAYSVMLLTIFDLWIACDIIAVNLYPLLNLYDCGIGHAHLECLVLPFRSQMARLLAIEQYLRQRQRSAKLTWSRLYMDSRASDCFAVRYFDGSPQLQAMHAKIKSWAKAEREKKLEELRLKKHEYTSLIRQYEKLQCEFVDVVVRQWGFDFPETIHKEGCEKCSLRSKADAITIEMHEWPLSEDINEAKATVFELQAPHGFAHWRDCTLFVAIDVLKAGFASSDSPRETYYLTPEGHLPKSITIDGTPLRLRRVVLLSETKPHMVTHRKSSNMSVATEESICVANGLRYRYFDARLVCFTSALASTNDVPKACMYKLHPRCQKLQQYLFRPASAPNGPTANTSIAGQDDCPDHLTLDEYKPLTGMAFGYHLAWPALLSQLRAPCIDFQKEETQLIIFQCINQAGPRDDEHVLRASHRVTEIPMLANALMQALNKSLETMKENWESCHATHTLISVAVRLLTINESAIVTQACLQFLQDARYITHRWVDLLRQQAQETTEDQQRTELMAKSVEIALICVCSFNMEQKHLEQVLSTSENASTWLTCSIAIREGHATLSASCTTNQLLLRFRGRQVIRRSLLIVRKAILDDSRALDHAIRRSWSAYRPGKGWQIEPRAGGHWLLSHTESTREIQSAAVHFNLLTGQILVNGLPLAQPPSQYEDHPTYRLLFGRYPIEVLPTTVPGMELSVKREHAGHIVHLGMSDVGHGGSNKILMVHSTKDDKNFDLVPHHFFRDILPDSFIDEYVHWYNSEDACVEFRPVKDPWSLTSPDIWRLRKQSDSHWVLTDGLTTVVSLTSPTAKLISSLLRPLTDSSSIICRHHSQSDQLDACIPALKLGFIHMRGHTDLESKEFPRMCIDANQALGTLIGFSNKVILKNRLTSERLVVLLEGKATCVKYRGHVRVSVPGVPVRYHTYRVDDHTRRLIDNDTLQSKLWSCYLHGLTSFCIPDPFLLRTGTEQALSLLESAGVRSFDQLSEEHLEVLGRIASLTPSRNYYPRQERVMQTVKWQSNLGFLAQHGEFRRSVQAILDQARNSMMFYPDAEVSLSLETSDEGLQDRDRQRNATYRVSGFGAEAFTAKNDRKYASRDQNHGTGRSNAFELSRMVFTDRGVLHIPPPESLASHLWLYCSQPATGAGAGILHDLPVQHDASWLDTAAQTSPGTWMRLHHAVASASAQIGKFQFMMWLATLSRVEGADLLALQTLAALFKNPNVLMLSISDLRDANLSDGRDVKKGQLGQIIRAASKPLRECPEVRIAPIKKESKSQFQRRRTTAHETNRDSVANELTTRLAAQWPCDNPSSRIGIDNRFERYINVQKALKDADEMFRRWFINKQFWDYLEGVEKVVGHMSVSPLQRSSERIPLPIRKISCATHFISTKHVFRSSIPSNSRTMLQLHLTSETVDDAQEHGPARTLLEQLQLLTNNASKYEQEYVEHLLKSVICSEGQKARPHLKANGEELKSVLDDHLRLCHDGVRQTYDFLMSNTRSPHNSEGSSTQGADVLSDLHGPRFSPVLFLQQLHHSRWTHLSESWQVAIVNYALAIIALQRAERMLLLCTLQNYDDLIGELTNPGHGNWNPFELPETLLLEVESAIRIREVQEQIALEMRCPESGRNSIVQLNMGEGKSSVIVPMVAATFADGVRLARVVVAKPQAKQMFHMLNTKLGGMLHRRIYHMPFSRALRLDTEQAEKLLALHQDCIRNSGIFLVQPEHILSLKLMGLETCISGNVTLANSIFRILDLVKASSRDIVDESDDILSVKFELIYTMGKQCPIELGPIRWTAIHQILSLVRKFAADVADEVPRGLELALSTSGGFPRTRILQQEAGQRIVHLIARFISDNGLEGFPLARQPKEVRDAVFAYITESEPKQSVVDMVEDQHFGSFWSDEVKSLVLLLRGLLVGNLLLFAFYQKRWRVDYGHSFGRRPSTRLAVPYKAKDQPSARSEFSHPDVVILLTSLSYYYAGLRDEDLFLAFEHLMRADQADSKYQAWLVGMTDMPVTYKHLAGINLKDQVHCTGVIFPLLRHATGAINYFLSNIVFPREMLEFPHKLSASGWDIGDVTTHPTTGFSGTNDRRIVLPLTVEHVDLPEQTHTNATVLNLLLRPENSVARILSKAEDPMTEAEWLLNRIIALDPPVQVILDVGAQILELTNKELASKWLSLSASSTQAVVYFNDDDELWVLDRSGLEEPLQVSPFVDQLHVCLVFLDEAHTRGTDLKLPSFYRAAVTLGASMTKDRLVQACMRMRKLGKGQAVVFCVSDEIAARIGRCVPELHGSTIKVSDILLWTIQETTTELKRLMPLWAMQGNLYQRQLALWEGAGNTGSTQMTQEYATQFLEPEAQSLSERYQPSSIQLAPSQESTEVSGGTYRARIVERLADFKCPITQSSSLEEEQERELAPEIEAERQVQRPAGAKPAAHTLHRDLKTLVDTGELPEKSTAFMPAFASLKRTAAAANCKIGQFDLEHGLLVTRDFARTIVTQKGDCSLDAYQRPVQWVLTTVDKVSRFVRNMIVISPFEAQELFPQIWNSHMAALHVYTPRVNLAHPSLDRLDLFTLTADQAYRQIPQSLSVQLNLFAGQLYFETYAEYLGVCTFLGLSYETAQEGWEVAVDGFILRDDNGRVGGSSNLTQSPVNFLRLLLTTIRRNAKLDPSSDMGKVLGGGLMRPDDFKR